MIVIASFVPDGTAHLSLDLDGTYMEPFLEETCEGHQEFDLAKGDYVVLTK